MTLVDMHTTPDRHLSILAYNLPFTSLNLILRKEYLNSQQLPVHYPSLTMRRHGDRSCVYKVDHHRTSFIQHLPFRRPAHGFLTTKTPSDRIYASQDLILASLITRSFEKRHLARDRLRLQLPQPRVQTTLLSKRTQHDAAGGRLRRKTHRALRDQKRR